jgi:hypothetical protein
MHSLPTRPTILMLFVMSSGGTGSSRSFRRSRIGNAVIRYNKRLYRKRNCIQRIIGHLKINRTIATRQSAPDQAARKGRQPDPGSLSQACVIAVYSLLNFPAVRRTAARPSYLGCERTALLQAGGASDHAFLSLTPLDARATTLPPLLREFPPKSSPDVSEGFLPNPRRP